MEIKDLAPRQGNVDITIDVVEKGDVREFDKFGKSGRVCNAQAKDATGTIKLTLWNDDIDKVNAGDKVQLTNGYVSEFQGELQLTTGKFGKLEVVGKSEETAESTEATTEETAESTEATTEPVEAPEDLSIDEEKVE